MTKTLVIITIIVLVLGVFLYFIIKELIRTFRNRPYDPDERKKLKTKDRL
jgi:heme/copper-type cytochrome/quinol oxidase subunit 2